MEQLRKDTKWLAIWNLVVPLIVTYIMVKYLVGQPPKITSINMHTFTVWVCVIFAIIFPILYCLWFKFFKGMKNVYADNTDMQYVIKIGKIAFILYAVAFLLAWVATIFDAFIITPQQFGCDINIRGIIPRDIVGAHCNDLIAGAGYIYSIMFLFLIRLTKPRTTMRALSIILALRYPVMFVATMAIFGVFSVLVVDVLFWIVEFVFLIQIYRGYEFGREE